MSITPLITLSFLLIISSVYASITVPTYRLNDGYQIPSFGLGTWLGTRNLTAEDEAAAEQAVVWAIEAGYRLFDTASTYNTEKSVGNAVRKKIEEGVIKREDVFIITKLWNNAHAREAVVPNLEKSLQALSMDYVDLYLIHCPIGGFENGTYDFTDYVETWHGMIDARRRGLAKSIGVSNFNERQMERIIKNSCVKPAVVEIEVNLNKQQSPLLKYSCQNDIMVVGFTPFGSIFYESAKPGSPGPRVDDPVLVQIANNHNKTVPQIVLRYLLELGVIPIPKSVHKSRLEENINVFDFSLTQEERRVMADYDVNYSSGLNCAVN